MLIWGSVPFRFQASVYSAYDLFFQVFGPATRLPPESQKFSAVEPGGPRRDFQDKSERGRLHNPYMNRLTEEFLT